MMALLHSEYDAMESSAEVEFCQEDGSIIADDETIVKFLINEGFDALKVSEFMSMWKEQDN